MILALFISVKYYKVSDDFDNYIEVSELENRILDSQLTEILHKYDSISAKSKIDSLRFHEKMSLMQSGKSLSNKTKFNSVEDSIVFYAKKQQTKAVLLNNKSSVAADAKLLPKTDKLSALNINAKGVKIYSDNYSLKDSKIQQLRVCFTLEENQLVKSGEKTIYVQIVNPKNQIISAGNTSVESDLNVKLQYSASVETNYKKEDTDVCTYVNLEQKKTIKGKYKINIYHDFVKIGTAVFEY
jgi:hypothetical protein